MMLLKQKNGMFSRQLHLYIALFLLIAAPLAFISTSSLNPDGIEYVVIARHYLDFNFSAAVNGIWSPILSWLLVIPLSIGIDPFVFFRIALLLISIVIIALFEYLLKILGIGGSRHGLLHHAALFFIVSFCVYATGLTPVTPDLLTVLFTLLLVILVVRHYNVPSMKSAMLLGVAAGVGYYAKTYFFYFAFACVLMLFATLIYRRNDLKTMISQLAVTAIVSFIIVLPWLILMSIKYDHPTLNPIGDYAVSQVGPNYPGAPVATLGLLEPPYDKSITAREDPTSFDYVPWDPLGSKKDAYYYLRHVIIHNVLTALKLLWPILVVLGAAIILRIWQPRKQVIMKDPIFIGLLAVSAVYIAGYCLVHLDGGFRYVWPAYILLAVAFFLVATELNKKTRLYLLTIGTLLISIYPLYTNYTSAFRSTERGKESRNITEKIKNEKIINISANIASNDPYKAAEVCYFLSLRCYGLPKKHGVQKQLTISKIDYFINFKNRRQIPVRGEAVYEDSVLEITEVVD